MLLVKGQGHSVTQSEAFFVVSLLMRLTTICLVASKITTVDDFTAPGVMRPLEIVGLIVFTRICHEIFFLQVVNVLLCSPFWSMTVVYTVCTNAVISPLRQLLDSYAKTSLKNVSREEEYYSYAVLLVVD